MKVTIDIDKLLEDGKINALEYETLKGWAQSDTTSLALNILLGFGVIAVAGGMLALLASSIASIAIGLGVTIMGVYLGVFYSEKWNAFSVISIVIGALIFGGGVIALTEGSAGGFILLTVAYFGTGLAIKNSLLVVLSPLSLFCALGAFGGYEHASYFLGTEQPTLTILLFSALAAAAHFSSTQLDAGMKNAAIVFSRTCLFFVNFGFWIGSLWGDHLFAKRDYLNKDVTSTIPDLVFVFGWAIALFLLGLWAWKNNRRWVLNLVAVFGAIHFYTQWFERLGANPGSILFAGILAIGITIGLINLNRTGQVD